jgi:hypothetical protein
MVSNLTVGEGQLRRSLSYLLRLWQVDGQERPLWRASLKSVDTGEQVGFACLEELFAFLREAMGGSDRKRAEASDG